jgi:hypothetical protein
MQIIYFTYIIHVGIVGSFYIYGCAHKGAILYLLSTGTKEIESHSDCLSLSNSLTEMSVDTFDYRIVVLLFANSWQQDPVLCSHIMCKNFDEKIGHHTVKGQMTVECLHHCINMSFALYTLSWGFGCTMTSQLALQISIHHMQPASPSYAATVAGTPTTLKDFLKSCNSNTQLPTSNGS